MEKPPFVLKPLRTAKWLVAVDPGTVAPGVAVFRYTATDWGIRYYGSMPIYPKGKSGSIRLFTRQWARLLGLQHAHCMAIEEQIMGPSMQMQLALEDWMRSRPRKPKVHRLKAYHVKPPFNMTCETRLQNKEAARRVFRLYMRSAGIDVAGIPNEHDIADAVLMGLFTLKFILKHPYFNTHALLRLPESERLEIVASGIGEPRTKRKRRFRRKGKLSVQRASRKRKGKSARASKARKLGS